MAEEEGTEEDYVVSNEKADSKLKRYQECC